MLKKYIVAIIAQCVLTSAYCQSIPNAKHYDFSIMAGMKNYEVGVGFSPTGKICIPLSVGISSNFTENRLNDWSIEIWPGYRLQKHRFVFPVGIIAGAKRVMNFSYTYPVLFGGFYTGFGFCAEKSTIGINLGLKYGSHRYVIEKEEVFAHLSAYETYRENRVVGMVTYSVRFK